MNASVGYRVDYMIDTMWTTWTNMFPSIPYWDPYGALAAVFLAIIGLAFLVRIAVR